MKYLFYLSSVFIIFSCTNQTDSTKKSVAILHKKMMNIKDVKPVVHLKINYDSLDVRVKTQVKILDSIYGRTPYYAVVNNKTVFVVIKNKLSAQAFYQVPKYSGEFKYGLVDDALKPMLACNYDKIYNPNLTILNCMEVKVGKKIGLYNFSTNELLEPQFEYIMPSSKTPDNTAYGMKDGGWYKIEGDNKFKILKTYFSPNDILRTLKFDVKDVKENLYYDSYCSNDTTPGPDDFREANGKGVIVTPSYLEHLNILPEICDNLRLPTQKNNVWIAADEENAKTDTSKSVTDKIIAFIVSVYQSGTSGRGYVNDEKNMVVYNKEKKTINAIKLDEIYDYTHFCRPSGYRFINDTMLETKTGNGYDTTKPKYIYEPKYKYHVITKDGEIKELNSNRHFNFTKFIEIDDSYFNGCYAKFVEEKDMVADSNLWMSEHLDMEDLDIMTNEIYADYGLKFKTTKWQTYFNNKTWYKPLYDNVDTKLSAIDKKNIETIAKEKTKLKGKENLYTKKHRGQYYGYG